MRKQMSAFLGLLVLVSALVGTAPSNATNEPATALAAAAAGLYQPDAWISLCGLSDGCTINPPPHPWKGKDIYNTTGAKQLIAVKMEDGEGVRFWITIESDGTEGDTFTIEGCTGTKRFRVNKVQIGFHKRPQAGTVKITDEFKAGTATFPFPQGAGNKVELTLNIIAPTTAEGVTYECPVTIHSTGDPGATDTLIAKMTTY